jgi:hypothetical protein
MTEPKTIPTASLWDEDGRWQGDEPMDLATMERLALILIERDLDNQRLRGQLDDWEPSVPSS